MKNEPFAIERIINAHVAEVWKAITDKNEMKQWYFDLVEFKPEVGFEFQFNGAGNDGKIYVHICKVTEVIPNQKLSYTWRYEEYPGSSTVTFELFPEGNKTKLKLTHEGLETFPGDNPDFAVQSFAAGWTYIIGTSLPKHFENHNAKDIS